jgi:Domain of unknown function (DUF4598)
MTEPMTTRPAKRSLRIETSFEERVLKRRRSSAANDSSGLVVVPAGSKDDVEDESDDEISSDENSQLVDGDSETSSSDENETSSEESDDEEDEEGLDQPLAGLSSAGHRSMLVVGEIEIIPLPQKPTIATINDPSDLRSRLSMLLPQLQKANAELQSSDEALNRRLDDVDDDEEHYIEMNLGLGVLKEKRAGLVQGAGVRLTAEECTSSDDASDLDSEEEAGGVTEVEDAPLSKLLQKRGSATKKPGIQEIPGS